jgi:ParB family transcriptional regulator, chromosome partitioning protein
LLRLPISIREKVIIGELSEGHARALLAVQSDQDLNKLAEKVIRGKLSVRQTEKLTRDAKEKGKKNEGKEDGKENASSDTTTDVSSGVSSIAKSISLRDLERRLSNAVTARCEVNDKDGQGTIIIAYNNEEQREAIIEKLLGL